MPDAASMTLGMTWRRVVALAAVAAGAGGCGSGGAGVVVHIGPPTALIDTPVNVRVDGLRPRERVTIEVSARSHAGRRWHADLATRANAHGSVRLRRNYVLALLRPDRMPPRGDYLVGDKDIDLAFVVHADHRAAVGRARLILQPGSVSIADERPNRVGFYGEWLTRQGTRHRPAILYLGGSEGGEPLYVAPYVLAARGYPVLALAYFGEPGLPSTLKRIPLEYFRRALKWMRRQPGVDARRIVTFGVSYGGQLSLILASTFPKLVDAAVDYTGADIVFSSPVDANQPAWTYHGKPLPLSIPVDRIPGPVFAVGGGDDHVSPSGAYTQDLRQELHTHNRRDVILVYPRAGHFVGLAVPNQPKPTGVHSVYGRLYVDSIYGRVFLGGSLQADEAAREDSWPRLLLFLAQLRRR